MLQILNGPYLTHSEKESKATSCKIALTISQHKPFFASKKKGHSIIIKSYWCFWMLSSVSVSWINGMIQPDHREILENIFQGGTCAQSQSEVLLKYTHSGKYKVKSVPCRWKTKRLLALLSVPLDQITRNFGLLQRQVSSLGFRVIG